MASSTTARTTTGTADVTKPQTDLYDIISVYGTYGTVTFTIQGSVDGTNFFNIAAINMTTGALVTGGTTISPTDNTTYCYKVPSDGLSTVRVTVTAIASGTFTIVHNTYSVVGPAFNYTNNAGVTNASLTATSYVSLPDNALIKFGDSDDVTIGWDGTDLDILAAADNSTITVGASGNSFDLKIFGSGASTFFTWDTSANSLKMEDNCYIGFGTNTAGVGTLGDINITWNGTKLLVAQTTANSAIDWGVDGAGIDHVFYGDTASTNMTWDQSADTLLFTGTAYIAGNKMATVANDDGTLTIDATHSGKMITTRGASGATTITLPTVAAGFTGVHFYVFNCVDQDLTLSAQTAGQIMFKNDLAANTVAYAQAGEKIGGAFFVHCDGTSWLVMPLAEEAATIAVTT